MSEHAKTTSLPTQNIGQNMTHTLVKQLNPLPQITPSGTRIMCYVSLYVNHNLAFNLGNTVDG